MHTALCHDQPLPKARTACLRTIHHPEDSNRILDASALVLFFPAPRTVTGEDILELHVHGGPAIVSSILGAIGYLSSTETQIRYAEPGEFTRRAFYNDRLDLTQVEALGDSLNAVTEEQRRLSVQIRSSRLGDTYEEWRRMLLHARGELEALIDFSEDQHFDESPAELAGNVGAQVRKLISQISYHRENAMRGELLRNGIVVSLIGTPNAGKSSLLNCIVGRNAAIVSEKAGTTRDIVEVGIDLGGFLCRLGDTAGLRKALEKGYEAIGLPEGMDEVEKEGIRRARAQAEQSNVVIVVLSIGRRPGALQPVLQLHSEVISTANRLAADGKHLLVVINKVDLLVPVTEVLAPSANDSILTGTSFKVTWQRKLVSAVRRAIPSVLADNVYLISCTRAQAAHRPNSQAGSLQSTDKASTSADTVSDEDPGNLHAFVSGLVQSFRDITTASQAKDEDRHPITAADHDLDGGVSIPRTANPSLWEESLGVTTRQRQLLETCQAELNHFLDLVPGARPAAASRSHAQTPLQDVSRAHGASVEPRGVFKSALAETDEGQRLVEYDIPDITLVDKPSVAPHDQCEGGDATGPITVADAQAAIASAPGPAELICADPTASFDGAHAGSLPPAAVAANETKAEAQAAVRPVGCAHLIDPGLVDLQDGDRARGCSCAEPAPPPRSGHTQDTVARSQGRVPLPTDPQSLNHTNPPDDHRVSSPVSSSEPAPEDLSCTGVDEVDIVAAAEHLRAAAAALGRIRGKNEDVGDVEEVLGVVFER